LSVVQLNRDISFYWPDAVEEALINPRGIAAFDALPAQIAILDAGGSIFYVNAAWRQIAADNGSPNPQGLCGTNYLEVCQRAASAGDASADAALKGINKVISGEARCFKQRYPCEIAGAERWFLMTVTRAADGRDIVISHDDITVLVRAEQEREAAEQGLHQSRAVQRQTKNDHRVGSIFVDTLEHEIRTPLNAILGFSEIIRDQLFGDDPRRYSSYADDIHKSASRLLNVIRAILRLAKIEAGRCELRESSIKLDKHLRECVRALGVEAERRGVELSAGGCSGITLIADETALREIIVNLLANAVNFTQRGGKVSLSATRKSNGCLLLAIRDNGKGMAVDEVRQATKPFRQVGGGAYDCEGAGLGLPIALRLTELHGGSLEIESIPGLGTTVSVVFPAWRVSA
jgi:signal transduction histidine kinase